MTRNPPEDGYRIGAVSRMTGIALPTLRMWERRYKVVTPLRTPAGGRIYRREQVARLALLHAAVQAGHQIGSVVTLTDAQLQERIRGGLGDRAGSAPSRIAVIGPALPALMLSSEVADPTVELVAQFDDISEAGELADAGLDALILELPTFHADDLEAVLDLIRQTGARLNIVVYAFTNRKLLRRLDLMDVLCVRAPADIPQLLRLCRLAQACGGDAGAPVRPRDDVDDAAVPPRHFTDTQLQKLGALNSSVQCECPQHLAMQIASLAAFERYSSECEVRSPDDLSIHKMLNQASAKARHTLETALKKLLTAENIQV